MLVTVVSETECPFILLFLCSWHMDFSCSKVAAWAPAFIYAFQPEGKHAPCQEGHIPAHKILWVISHFPRLVTKLHLAGREDGKCPHNPGNKWKIGGSTKKEGEKNEYWDSTTSFCPRIAAGSLTLTNTAEKYVSLWTFYFIPRGKICRISRSHGVCSFTCMDITSCHPLTRE